MSGNTLPPIDNNGPEFNQRAATDIYDQLQAQRGRASLSGFDQGEVLYPEAPDGPLRIAVHRMDIVSEPERAIFRARGFTDEDLDSGVTSIIESEFRNPNWPNAQFQDEPTVRYLNVSNTGKVLATTNRKTFAPAELSDLDVDALQTVARLSMLPRQIVELFGSYDAFQQVLGYPTMLGVDWAEFRPMQILYNGGLRAFVDALRAKSEGELGSMDSMLHELRDSLDHRSHFDKLADTMERFRQDQRDRAQEE